jgi:type II secretory pathway predicted ATPase ExeA
MSRIPASELRRLEAVEAPEHSEVLERANEFVARRGISIGTFADLVGIGQSTMNIWSRDAYDAVSPTQRSTAYIDARVWTYITRHWPRPDETSMEEILETQGFRKIRECIEQAVEVGANSLIYGPPSSEKSFVAEQIAAQYRAAGRRDLIYISCGATDYSPLSLFKDLAREAEVWMRSTRTRDYVEAIVEEFHSRESLPAIILDEAQSIAPEALETLRLGIYERTKRNRPDGSRRGSGMVILGSHTLYSRFVHPARRFQFEQFLSRISYRVHLEGMSREEVLEIGARALGSNGKKAKLTPGIEEWFLKSCRVLDPYATDAEGNALRDGSGKPAVRTYYSSRRLLEAIRQKKRKAVSLIVAEEVA